MNSPSNHVWRQGSCPGHQLYRDSGHRVYGFTTPSQTGVEVIGHSTDDYAIAVMIEGKNEAVWIAANLLEFLDHQPGTTIQVGSRHLVRDEQGQWHEVKLP